MPVSSDRADYGLRIFNPDGGEAEKSGNGLRIYARFLVDHRGAPDTFSVDTPGGVVGCQVEAAQDRLRAIVEEFPRHADAHNNLATICLSNGDEDRAREELRLAVESR